MIKIMIKSMNPNPNSKNKGGKIPPLFNLTLIPLGNRVNVFPGRDIFWPDSLKLAVYPLDQKGGKTVLLGLFAIRNEFYRAKRGHHVGCGQELLLRPQG